MGIIENIKEVVSLIQKTGNIEQVSQLLDVQKEALELLEQNGKLRKQVSELEDQIKIKGEVKIEGGVYYRYPEEGEREGPYCTRCYDVKGLLVRLVSYPTDLGGGSLQSPECRTYAPK